MLVSFRQGLVRAPKTSFVLKNRAVSLIIQPNDAVIVAFADGQTNYLINEQHTIYDAWAGPFASGVDYWLYWDLHLVTGVRTFGYTMHEPVEGPTPPQNPENDQHWFDTTTGQLKVYQKTASRWQRVVRVFAAHLQRGGVFLSMGDEPNEFTGTQAGLRENVNIGSLIYDNHGNIIKKKDGTFFTTEDYAITGIANSSQVKFASIQVIAEAEVNIPAFSIVYFTQFNKIRPANNDAVGKVNFGIVEHDVAKGDVVNVVMDGAVQNSYWDWPNANIPLYVNEFGALTMNPGIPPRAIASVIDKHTILLMPAAMFMNRSPVVLDDELGTSLYVPPGLKIEAHDAPTTPMTLVNKAYVDQLFVDSDANINIINKKNVSGENMLKGTPVAIAAGSADGEEVVAASAAEAGNDVVRTAVGVVIDEVINKNEVGRVMCRGIVELEEEQWETFTGEAGGLRPGFDYFMGVIPGSIVRQPPSDDRTYVVRMGKALTKTKMDVDIGAPIKI